MTEAARFRSGRVLIEIFAQPLEAPQHPPRVSRIFHWPELTSTILINRARTSCCQEHLGYAFVKNCISVSLSPAIVLRVRSTAILGDLASAY